MKRICMPIPPNLHYLRTMNKTHVFVVLYGMILCLVLPYAIVNGKQKTIGLIFAPLFIVFFIQMSERIIRILFIALILINMLSIKWLHIPYLGPPIMALMFIFCALQHSDNLKLGVYRKYSFFGVFAIISLVATLMHKELPFWIYGAMPFLCMLTVEKMFYDEKQKKNLIHFVLFMLVGYVSLYLLSTYLGNINPIGLSEEYAGVTDTSELTGWGIGSRFVTFGPFYYIISHNMQAGVLSIACIIFFWLFSKKRQPYYLRIIEFVSFITSFILIIWTTGRAILIATTLAVLFMMIFTTSRRLILYIGAVCLMLVVLNISSIERIISFLTPGFGGEKYSELGGKLSSITNYMNRIDIFSETFIMGFSKPLGHGFGYYESGGIDEAILFSNVISGTGLIGFSVFILIMIKLLYSFIAGILNSRSDEQKGMAILGLGTLILILVSGFSQRYLFGFQIYALSCWLILAATYSAVNNRAFE